MMKKTLLALFLSFQAYAGLYNSVPSSDEADVQSRKQGVPTELEGIKIQEYLGKEIDFSKYRLQDDEGKEVQVSDYFQAKKPVVFTFVYFNCPNICTFVLNGTVEGLREIKEFPGKDFEWIVVSIDPREKYDLAQQKKKAYLELYEKPEAGKGWHFLTGDEKTVRALAEEIGFGYKWDDASSQYAHGAALFFFSPQAKLTRILYGLSFKPKDLRLALVEASEGKTGSFLDQVILYCYRYDPNTRSYSMVVMNLVRIGAALTVVLMGLFLGAFFWRQKVRKSLI